MQSLKNMRTGIVPVICLALGLGACGQADEPSESSSTPRRSESAQSAAPSADALGGGTTTASSLPAGPGGDKGANTGNDLNSAPPALTPATLDTTQSADAKCYKAGVTACAMEQAILTLINSHRDATTPFALDPKLAYVARNWSDQQQIDGAVGHRGFPDKREAVYLGEFGLEMPFFLAAENVGITFGTDELTVDQLSAALVDMWWNSPAHRANMLGNYAVAGVGVSISADAKTIVVSALFGAP